jgi:hypothetical protein
MPEYQCVTVDSFRSFHSQSFKSYTKDGFKGVASPSYGAVSGNITEENINIEKDKSEDNVVNNLYPVICALNIYVCFYSNIYACF